MKESKHLLNVNLTPPVLRVPNQVFKVPTSQKMTLFSHKNMNNFLNHLNSMCGYCTKEIERSFRIWWFVFITQIIMKNN
ncbi:hypothetical protein BpHYR1_007207 [Brachionus plicatilis]|uniref:Uncharacterized protein n=1 Tax=Brachionus plicatilis TaxID=10195 RepID=A0A3M7SQ56_BRAPC|nr:hypothetical protein BpHYR1_007207 [Brachionus plicatilis]